MLKRIFIVHGWGGSPNQGWLMWLKRELEKRGFAVTAPEMPDTENPKIETWVPHLAKLVGKPDENTYLVGYSIGCQTILRYLECLNESEIVGGAVLVAGFVRVTGLELEQEEKPIIKPWLQKPLDLEKTRRRAKHFVAIHSDNDPFVPLENADIFKRQLGAEVMVKRKIGHFDVAELPPALKAVLKITKNY